MIARLSLLTLAVLLCSVASNTQEVNGWNEVASLSYLYYSYATYCPQDQLNSWNCKWCKQKGVQNFVPTAFPYDDSTKCLGFVGYNPDNKTILVSFRGSSNLQNWIVDLKFSEITPYENSSSIYVHSGFYYAYGNLSSQVRKAVSALKTKYPTYSLAVTGHSLGAALSIFCALDLVEMYPSDKIYINNFGEPRCGNKAFADYFRSIPNFTTWRLVNNQDIVPDLPLQGMSQGFYHEPTEVWERTDSSGNQYYKVCSSTNGEDPTCSDSVKSTSSDDHLLYMGLQETCQ